MKTITPLELQERLASEPGLLLLDVRTPIEYAQVHVTQARNKPLGDVRPADWPGSQPVYLLCQSGGRAAKAAELFEAAGEDRGVVIEGGTQAWLEAGLPVVRGAVKTISLERQVRIVAGALVLTGVLLGCFVHPWFFGLSGLVGAGLMFAGISGWCGMALLLAKLPWNSGPVCIDP
jgi:rhodanese-related sulfurtransferase